MKLALDASGSRVTATRGASAACEICHEPVRPNCGDIIPPYWSHLAGSDCDTWHEPITEWHRAWQEAVPEDRQEVIIRPHRADVVAFSGEIVELQHSHITPAMITEREEFYGDMLWIFNATFCGDRLSVSFSDPAADFGSAHAQYRWTRARESIAFCTKPVLLDLADGQVLRLLPPPGGLDPRRGKGFVADRLAVRRWMLDGTDPGWRPTAADIAAFAAARSARTSAVIADLAERCRKREREQERSAEIALAARPVATPAPVCGKCGEPLVKFDGVYDCPACAAATVTPVPAALEAEPAPTPFPAAKAPVSAVAVSRRQFTIVLAAIAAVVLLVLAASVL